MNSAEITTMLCVALLCTALLFALSTVASCTRDVAKISAQVELSCSQRGLVYFGGIGPDDPGRCVVPKR